MWEIIIAKSLAIQLVSEQIIVKLWLKLEKIEQALFKKDEEVKIIFNTLKKTTNPGTKAANRNWFSCK